MDEQIEEQTIIKQEVVEQEINVFYITEQERDLLARLVFLEGGAESYECKKAIISVVFNQLMDGRWGDNIKSIIYYRGLYSTAKSIKRTIPYRIVKNGYKEAWDDCFRAVDEVVKYGSTIPQYVKYFSAGGYHKWKGYVGYIRLDKTYFGYISWECND